MTRGTKLGISLSFTDAVVPTYTNLSYVRKLGSTNRFNHKAGHKQSSRPRNAVPAAQPGREEPSRRSARRTCPALSPAVPLPARPPQLPGVGNSCALRPPARGTGRASLPARSAPRTQQTSGHGEKSRRRAGRAGATGQREGDAGPEALWDRPTPRPVRRWFPRPSPPGASRAPALPPRARTHSTAPRCRTAAPGPAAAAGHVRAGGAQAPPRCAPRGHRASRTAGTGGSAGRPWVQRGRCADRG